MSNALTDDVSENQQSNKPTKMKGLLRALRNSDYKNPGAYGIRYLFVIYGFSVAETEKRQSRFLLGRALEGERSEPF